MPVHFNDFDGRSSRATPGQLIMGSSSLLVVGFLPSTAKAAGSGCCSIWSMKQVGKKEKDAGLPGVHGDQGMHSLERATRDTRKWRALSRRGSH